MNRIGKTYISSKNYSNPLKEFKKGQLEWGKAIQEIFVDLVKEMVFDVKTSESKVFERQMPDIKAIFHEVNRRGFFKTTVHEQDLNLAFTSENGMMALVDKITRSLYTSDELNEFLYMKGIIHQYGVEGKFTLIPVGAITDEASAKAAMVEIKTVAEDMTFMKTKYNYAGVNTFTLMEDQIVLVNPRYKAMINVEVLASAFNIDKADFTGRVITIDDFGGLTNVVCAIVDKDWFMVEDKIIRTEELWNPEGLYWNYWLHHHQVLSASMFANAVLFVSVEPELTAINLLPATASVVKGGSINMVVEAVGTGNPSSKCTFAVTGNSSSDTHINSMGLLFIGEDETGTTGAITVTATSIIDDEITDTATITIV
jgi:hypothetical protein